MRTLYPSLGIGTLKSLPEDFKVIEEPLYPCKGEGEHLYLCIEKIGVNSSEAMRHIAKILQTDPKFAGIAGQKDKHALTQQWMSFHCPPTRMKVTLTEGMFASLEPSIKVLKIERHVNRLRTGHLKANSFEVTIRDHSLKREALEERLRQISNSGVPNYYGKQRFGHNNLQEAQAWLKNNIRVRDPKFCYSVLQSAVFNTLLERRIEEKRFDVVRLGDVMQKNASGGLFHAENVAESQSRYDAKEVDVTGPMPGSKMKASYGEVFAEEQAAADSFGLTTEMQLKQSRWGEGTRRAYRIQVNSMQVLSFDANAFTLKFSLESGAYATTIMDEILNATPPATHAAASA